MDLVTNLLQFDSTMSPAINHLFGTNAYKSIGKTKSFINCQ